MFLLVAFSIWIKSQTDDCILIYFLNEFIIYKQIIVDVSSCVSKKVKKVSFVFCFSVFESLGSHNL
jgi:hypothetical protein